MPKAHLISAYHSVSDPSKFAAYRDLAGPAIIAAGGRYIARGPAAGAMEAGVLAQTVVVEFDDLATALAVYDTQPTRRRYRRSTAVPSATCGSSRGSDAGPVAPAQLLRVTTRIPCRSVISWLGRASQAAAKAAVAAAWFDQDTVQGMYLAQPLDHILLRS